MPSRSYSRREFLAATGAGVSALAFPALAFPGVARPAGEDGAEAAPGISRFVSDPSLRPPSVTVTTLADPSPGFLFVASLNGPGQRGPLILDNHGQVVWFRHTDDVAIDFRRQIYAGKPVLTWWEGTIAKDGVGQGEGVIVDETYAEVARVRAGNGYQADVHELLLTPAGTALITVYDQVQADLSAVGGPATGNVLDSIVQEVDVRTGSALFEWHSLDHVPLADTFAPVLDPFDYFHVNSIDVDLDGNLLVSARNTSAVYKLDRKSGQVLWRLGGRSSDFQIGPLAGFMYQHDARAHPDGTITLFDDGPSSSSEQSRGIRLGLDLDAMRADLLEQYRHPTPLEASAMGNVQVIGGGGMLVGWGTEPYITEFGPLGNVRLDAKFDGDAWNYRAFRDPWVGRPTTGPSVATVTKNTRVTVYASWNGSTEIAYWQVSTGNARSDLRVTATVPASGFETAIPVSGRPGFVSVAALDRFRHPLAGSRVVAVHA